jgi:hypothetical protein
MQAMSRPNRRKKKPSVRDIDFFRERRCGNDA